MRGEINQMKRTLLLVACLMLVASVAFAAAAKPKPGTIQPNWWPGQKPKPVPVKQTVAVGTVAAVAATKIDVQTAQGVKSFAVFPKTKVVVQGKKATIADVKAGDPVRVDFRVINNVPSAARIAVPKPNIKGKITAINGNVITLKTKNAEFAVTVGEATKIKSKGYQGSLADLQVGFGAAVVGTISGNNIAADVIEFLPEVAKGAVTAVDGNTITIKAIRQQSITTIATEKTVILVRPRVGPNVKGTIADVKVGVPVNIGFKPVQDGPSPLFWIDVLTGM
jgi:hypothetical protein